MYVHMYLLRNPLLSDCLKNSQRAIGTILNRTRGEITKENHGKDNKTDRANLGIAHKIKKKKEILGHSANNRNFNTQKVKV